MVGRVARLDGVVLRTPDVGARDVDPAFPEKPGRPLVCLTRVLAKDFALEKDPYYPARSKLVPSSN